MWTLRNVSGTWTLRKFLNIFKMFHWKCSGTFKCSSIICWIKHFGTFHGNFLKKFMNIFKCSIGTFKIVCEHTESSRISVGTFWNVLEHWKSSGTYLSIIQIKNFFWKNVPEQAISYVHHVLKKSKIAQFNRPANRDSLLIKRVISCRANAERGRLPPARVRLPHTEGKRNTSMASMRR